VGPVLVLVLAGLVLVLVALILVLVGPVLVNITVKNYIMLSQLPEIGTYVHCI